MTVPLPDAVLRLIPPSSALVRWAARHLLLAAPTVEVPSTLPLLSLLSWVLEPAPLLVLVLLPEPPRVLPVLLELVLLPRAQLRRSVNVSLPPHHQISSPILTTPTVLGGLLGGGKGKGGAGGATGAGTKTPKGTKENSVAAAAGTGASSGLPTCADDGTITMTFHQVNQDGAGPLTAAIDPTSGGTDPAAFKDAQVTQNVPGLGIGGLSAATTTDFPVKVRTIYLYSHHG